MKYLPQVPPPPPPIFEIETDLLSSITQHIIPRFAVWEENTI